jgi:hypothetical protein
MPLSEYSRLYATDLMVGSIQGVSPQDLDISLLDQTFDVSFADEELAVLRQIETAILRLNLTRVSQYPDIDKDVFRRFKTSSEVDVGPLAFVLRKQLSVLMHVLLLFRRKRRSVRHTVGVTRSSSRPSTKDVLPVPDHLLEFVCPCAVVGEKAALVAAHAEVVDHERAGCGGIFCRVERRLNLCAIAGLSAGGIEGGQDFAVLAVEVADFFGHGLDCGAGVGWQVGEV